MELDQTTFYSIFGLSSKASEKEIRRSYIKLARELHPDKSKSDSSAEIFKIVVHAHSVLTDLEKKSFYDNSLKEKGLFHYNSSTSKQHSSPSQYVETVTNSKNISKETIIITKAKANRKSKPYEQQPYGFGAYEKFKSYDNGNIPKSHKINATETDVKSEKKHENNATNKKDDHIENSVSSEETFIQKEKNTKNSRTFSHSDDKEGNDEQQFPSKRVHLQVKGLRQNKIFNNNNNRSKGKKKNTSGSMSDNSFKESINADIQGPLNDLLNKFKERKIENNYTKFKKEERKFDLNLEDLSLDDYIEAKSKPLRIREPVLQSISLKELYKTLPKDEYEVFDMNKLKKSLKSVPEIKRLKTLNSNTNSNITQVNETEFDITNIYSQLPTVIDFPDRINSLQEVRHIKERITDFTLHCNQIKLILLTTLNDQLSNDINSKAAFLDSGDSNSWLRNKLYDMNITKILTELQDRQYTVAAKYQKLFNEVPNFFQ